MLSPLGNKVFTKTVAAAVSLHHTLSKDDTVARIIMDADAARGNTRSHRPIQPSP